MITQRVDADDPALGATVAKLRALAGRVDELVVLTLVARPTDLPQNVRVRSLGDGPGPLRGARLVGAVASELRVRPVAVLAHMSPVYALAAAPLTHAARVPLLLWFTHWRDSARLRAAAFLATRVLSADEVSFPFPTPKLVATGHGVPVPAEPLPPRPDDGTLRLLALGRTSPAKGLATIVEAVALLGDERVLTELRGPSLTAQEEAHRRELQARIERLGLAERIRLEQPIRQPRVVEVYARSDVLVNNMRAGALDKVVFEAGAAGRPVLVASPGFDSVVGGLEPSLRFSQDDAAALAERIGVLAAAGADERTRVGLEVRERILRGHSVERWADRVVEAAGG